MTRRWALAASLVLTVLVGFFVVTYGTNAGVFAWSEGSTATQAAPGIGSSPPEGSPAEAPALAPSSASGELAGIDQGSLSTDQQFARSDDDEHDGDGERDDDDDDDDDDEREHEDDDDHDEREHEDDDD